VLRSVLQRRERLLTMRLALRSLLCVALLAGSARAADTQVPLAAKPVDTVGATAALGALNATCTVALAGQNGAGLQLAAGTLVGTIVPELSFDGGTTWAGTFFDDPATSNKAASVVYGSANTATARTLVGAGGASTMRVRVSAFTSGTANCTLRASTVNDPSLLSAGPDNSTAPPTAMLHSAVMRAKGSAPATGTAGNAGVLIEDVEHRLLVNNVHPNFVTGQASAVTATTQVLGLSGASLSYYVTDVYFFNNVATAQTVNLVSSTTAGNACATAAVNVTPSIVFGAAANGQWAPPIQTPIKVAANSALCCKASTATSFSCLVSGFIGP
jgi:hypothetical protein